MSKFDVWVIRFQSGAAVSPVEGLQRIFGIDAAAAAEVEQTVPRVVRHRVQAEAAEQMRRALESIGAVVECRPARTSPRVEEAVSRPPDGISVPAAAAAERIKMEMPTVGSASLSSSLGLAVEPRVSTSTPAARPAQPRPVPPLSHPQPVPGPEGVESERSVETESVSEEPEPLLARLDKGLDALFVTRRRRCFAQAFAMVALAFVLIWLGQSTDNSIFAGEADWLGIGFAGLAFYLIGVAGHELYELVRG